MDSNDPELPRILTDEKKTIDLCGQQRDKARCVRTRGHDGPHEAFVFDRVEPVQWE